LGLFPGRRHRPAHPAPQVELVGQVEGQEEITGGRDR
jgi:hypothetical protein